MAKEIQVSKKHLPLKITVFSLAVVLAIGAFSFALVKMSSKEPGWYSIDEDTNETVPFAGYYLDLSYNFTGKSKDIKVEMNEVTKLYNEVLRYYYATYDETTSYDAYPSIGKINAHIGEDVKISDSLYETLQNAYSLSNLDNNYSIFAAPLYDYWERQAYSEDHNLLDPKYDENNKAYLEGLVNIINDTSNYSLEFKADNTVKLSISDTYKQYLEDNEASDTPIISLNILHDAYHAQKIVESLTNHGYTNGYLTSLDGLCINLGELDTLECYLYDYVSDKYYYYGNATPGEKSSFVSSRRFNLSKTDTSYILKDETERIYRNKYLDITTGYPNTYLSNVSLKRGDTTNLVDMMYKTNLFNQVNEDSDISPILTKLNGSYGVLYTLNDDNQKVYVNEYMKDYVTLFNTEQIHYELNLI